MSQPSPIEKPAQAQLTLQVGLRVGSLGMSVRQKAMAFIDAALPYLQLWAVSS